MLSLRPLRQRERRELGSQVVLGQCRQAELPVSHLQASNHPPNEPRMESYLRAVGGKHGTIHTCSAGRGVSVRTMQCRPACAFPAISIAKCGRGLPVCIMTPPDAITAAPACPFRTRLHCRSAPRQRGRRDNRRCHPSLPAAGRGDSTLGGRPAPGAHIVPVRCCQLPSSILQAVQSHHRHAFHSRRRGAYSTAVCVRPLPSRCPWPPPCLARCPTAGWWRSTPLGNGRRQAAAAGTPAAPYAAAPQPAPHHCPRCGAAAWHNRQRPALQTAGHPSSTPSIFQDKAPTPIGLLCKTAL